MRSWPRRARPPPHPADCDTVTATAVATPRLPPPSPSWFRPPTAVRSPGGVHGHNQRVAARPRDRRPRPSRDQPVRAPRPLVAPSAPARLMRTVSGALPPRSLRSGGTTLSSASTRHFLTRWPSPRPRPRRGSRPAPDVVDPGHQRVARCPLETLVTVRQRHGRSRRSASATRRTVSPNVTSVSAAGDTVTALTTWATVTAAVPDDGTGHRRDRGTRHLPAAVTRPEASTVRNRGVAARPRDHWHPAITCPFWSRTSAVSRTVSSSAVSCGRTRIDRYCRGNGSRRRRGAGSTAPSPQDRSNMAIPATAIPGIAKPALSSRPRSLPAHRGRMCPLMSRNGDNNEENAIKTVTSAKG